MPTSPRVRYKGRGRTGGVEPRPYGTVCRGGRPCPPAPDNATPCRAGPVYPAGCGKNLSGRRGRRPLQRVTSGCGMSGRCRHRPLRKCYKGCNGRATARVAPTDGLQEVQWAGNHEGRPYGGRVMGLRRFFCVSCKFILEKQLGICYTLHYSGNKFLSA